MNRFRTPIGQGLAAAALLLSAACGTSTTPAAPTAQAIATQAAPTVAPVASAAAAAASPVATQAAVAASPIATSAAASAPTVVAAASPVVAAASPAVATAVASSPVRITGAQLGASDTRITLQNASSSSVDLSGWKLQIGSATATLPPNTTVAPNDSLTLHTGTGTSAGKDVYLGQSLASLLSGIQPGAAVVLMNAQGTPVSEFSLPRS